MSDKDNFIASAKALARNPLGIIALFIVLVYAVASVVISFARAEFYLNPLHPAVLFLAIFPLVVLGAFTYLVARHHRHLYAPNDFKDSREFFYGLTIPSELQGTAQGVATSDSSGQTIPESLQQSIESKYSELVRGGFVLLHHAEVLRERTAPKTGLYRVRVWIESIDPERSIGEIKSVTYHVWNDFARPVLTTMDARSEYDLWLSIYGEFPVLALIRLKTGEEIDLHRYLDLPGRPPD